MKNWVDWPGGRSRRPNPQSSCLYLPNLQLQECTTKPGLQCWILCFVLFDVVLNLFILFYVYRWFAWMYVCVPQVCLLPPPPPQFRLPDGWSKTSFLDSSTDKKDRRHYPLDPSRTHSCRTDRLYGHTPWSLGSWGIPYRQNSEPLLGDRPALQQAPLSPEQRLWERTHCFQKAWLSGPPLALEDRPAFSFTALLMMVSENLLSPLCLSTGVRWQSPAPTDDCISEHFNKAVAFPAQWPEVNRSKVPHIQGTKSFLWVT